MHSFRSCLFHEFIWLFVCAATALCQAVPTATLRGKVLDDSTSMVLENVDVFLSQTTLGCATDKHGRFEIRNVPLGSYELVASRVGYQMRSMRVSVASSNPEQLVVALRPKPIEMNEVAVTATEAREWKIQLERFKKLFFGESEIAHEANLLNPEILDFTGNANPDFEATARMPLEIENLALGYHLQFMLTRFVINKTSPGAGGIFSDQQYLNCAGKERFIELTPSSVEQGTRWKANRMQAYKGSFRHFLVSLFRRELAREGFIMWLLPEQTGSFRSPGSVESIGEDVILSEGPVLYEKILHFTGSLVVKYVGKPVSEKKYLLDAPIPAMDVSSVRLNYQSVRFTSEGVIKDWAPTRLYGYWAASRIADALPLDYKPDELAPSNKDTAGYTTPTPSTCIVPLAIGNQWTIRISNWGAEGKLIASRYETSQILRDSIVDGERWFVMNNSGRNMLCANRPDGYYILRSGAKVLRIKYPANVGERFQGPNGELKVVSLSENISVTKGSFICYQYKVTGVIGLRACEYYSPGVGLVCIDYESVDPDRARVVGTGRVELVDYTLH